MLEYKIAPILDRLNQPTPEQIREARRRAKLNQLQAAKLVSGALKQPYRTWQGYEAEVGMDGHRAIPLSVWELFLLMTDQHPAFKLVPRYPKNDKTGEAS